MLRLLALMIFLVSPSLAAAARVALVLGNGDYEHAKALPNAANDARDVAATLRAQGFTVYDGIDKARIDTLRLIDEFNRALTPEDTALFYFAGHGLQLGAENWLMPVDAEQGDEIAITNTSIRLQTVLRGMELRAGNRIVILDACRNNPFLVSGASRSADGGATRGLSRIEAGVGSYIAFSTQPGNVALDGRGRNSPFTEALLRHLATPDQDIHAVMRMVRSDVVQASGGTQVPWENSSLIDPLFLVPTGAETEGRAGTRLTKKPEVTAQAAPAPAPAPAPSQLGAPPVSIGAAPPRSASRREEPGESCMSLGDAGRICATSVLKPQSGNTYDVGNLLDGRPETAWVEGRRDLGEGDFIAIDLNAPASFTELQLINGYAKSAALHANNSRVAVLRVTGSNGHSMDLRLSDISDWQTHRLSGFDGVTWIRLEIRAAVRGIKYLDTAISELRLR